MKHPQLLLRQRFTFDKCQNVNNNTSDNKNGLFVVAAFRKFIASRDIRKSSDINGATTAAQTEQSSKVCDI